MATGSRDKVLEVARDLFYRKGYIATSVDDILGETKVSKSNFYYHFKSKEELGLAVLDHRCEEFSRTLEATLHNPKMPPQERLAAFLKLVTKPRREDGAAGCPFGNLVAEMAEHSEQFRRQLSCIFSGLASSIEETVAEGQRSGAFRRDVPANEIAALVVQAVQGAQLMLKCHKQAEKAGQTAEVLLTLLRCNQAGRR